MGNTESNPVKNIDKRTARREYHLDFSNAIAKYRSRLQTDLDIDQLGGKYRARDGEISVCVRKRPINKSEIDCCEFDVITTLADQKSLVVHDARMGSDMKTQYIEHYPFKFNKAFSEKDGNEAVYRGTAAALIDVAFAGQLGTCMMYGQTGSGKTYTMTSFFERISADIFDRAHSSDDDVEISASFVEIAGDYCFDLFNRFAPVELLQVTDTGFQPWPVAEPHVQSAQELLSLIEYGCGVRTTAATGVHDASSRSHAVLRIYIRSPMRNGKCVREGILSLIDLAGSEHRIDSMYHSSERRIEGAEINASLAALKDCIRAKADSVDYDNLYRRSKLTMLLKSSFIDPESRTVVIVCVSPSSKDTEHTLNSLRYASVMENTGKQGSNKLLSKNRRGVVSTVDTGLGPKKNPFSVCEIVDGCEQWTLQHIRNKEMGYQYIGMINVSAIAKEKRMMRQNGILVPELRTHNGNNKVHASHDDSSDSRNLDLILRQRRINCRKYEGNLKNDGVLVLLGAAQGELGYFSVQNQRLWQNPRTKLFKALNAVGLSSSPVLEVESAEPASLRPKSPKPSRRQATPQRKRTPLRRRADSIDSECARGTRPTDERKGSRRDSSRIEHNRRKSFQEEAPPIKLPIVPVTTATEKKTKAKYSEHGWSRATHRHVHVDPEGVDRKMVRNIDEIIPKSDIKPSKPNSCNSTCSDAISRPMGEHVVCSILIDGKMHDNVYISRASIEAALQKDVTQSVTRSAMIPPTNPVVAIETASKTRTRGKFAASPRGKSPKSVRPTSAGTSQTSRRSYTSLPTRGVSMSTDDCANSGGKGANGKLIMTRKSSQCKSPKKACSSPRVKVQKSKYAVLAQNGKPFSGGFETLNTDIPDEYKVQRGMWQGAAGGPGWIGLDQGNDESPIRSSARSSTPARSSRAAVSRIGATDIENKIKPSETDNPFVSRLKIRNTNECSRPENCWGAPSNIWSPEMAHQRYGAAKEYKGFQF